MEGLRSLRSLTMTLVTTTAVFVVTVPKVEGTECWRQKMLGRNILYHFFNHTIKCPMTFQWTVADMCCYKTYDRYLHDPYCCYSEVYKLAVAVGFICLVLLGSAFCLFFCWFYNLPHHILYLLTCRRFRLNDWLAKTRNGPYVDPSFYLKEPFWSRGAETQPYPLRPMPPRIFYPAPPTNMKFRWDMGHGDIPLFILASRQFHRNPYSARPHDRSIHSQIHSQSQSRRGSIPGPESRRSSITTLAEGRESQSAANSSARRKSSGGQSQNQGGQGHGQSSGSRSWSHRMSISSQNQNPSNSHQQSKNYDPNAAVPFVIKIDEEEAAVELLDSIRFMDDKETNKENFKYTRTTPNDPISAPISTSTAKSIDDSLGQTRPGTSSQTTQISDPSPIFMTNSSQSIVPYTGRRLSAPSTNSTTIVLGGSGRNASERHQTPQYFSNYTYTQFSPQFQNSGHNNRSVMINGVGGVTNKVSVELLNQQLSSSLGLSISNLPNVHVIGNFSGGNGQMETIVEDEDNVYEEEEDYYAIAKQRGSFKGPKLGGGESNHLKAQGTPRISSALDRIVTRARQEVPFRPSLPGTIPNDNDNDTNARLSRRNSAPVNC